MSSLFLRSLGLPSHHFLLGVFWCVRSGGFCLDYSEPLFSSSSLPAWDGISPTLPSTPSHFLALTPETLPVPLLSFFSLSYASHLWPFPSSILTFRGHHCPPLWGEPNKSLAMWMKEALSSGVRINWTMGGDLYFLSLHSVAESQVVFRCVTPNS